MGKYDLVADMKKRFNKRFESAYLKAKQASDQGKLKLVDEFIMEPNKGHGFELKKGQVVHYELVDGPQILDTVYLVKSRPTEEFADAYPSAQYSSLTYYEGFHFYTYHPYIPYSGTFFEQSLNYRGSHDLVKICSRRIKGAIS